MTEPLEYTRYYEDFHAKLGEDEDALTLEEWKKDGEPTVDVPATHSRQVRRNNAVRKYNAAVVQRKELEAQLAQVNEVCRKTYKTYQNLEGTKLELQQFEDDYKLPRVYFVDDKAPSDSIYVVSKVTKKFIWIKAIGGTREKQYHLDGSAGVRNNSSDSSKIDLSRTFPGGVK